MIRRREAELMDEPGIAPAEHEHALASLERVNRLLRWNRMLVSYLDGFPRPARTIIDLGAGGGGLLATGWPGARRMRAGLSPCEAGVPVSPGLRVSVDRSPFALTCARRWHGSRLAGVVADARSLPLADGSADVVISSLFLHHFDGRDAILILKEAARVCRLGILVGDLSRSRMALAMTWITTRVISRSPVFHVDGVRSVRAAFTAGELRMLANEAGLAGARVERRFPFRLVLLWRKTDGRDG